MNFINFVKLTFCKGFFENGPRRGEHSQYEWFISSEATFNRIYNALFQTSILNGMVFILMERRENTATISPTSSHVRFHVPHQEKENFLDDLTKGTIHLRHQHFLEIPFLVQTTWFLIAKNLKNIFNLICNQTASVICSYS